MKKNTIIKSSIYITIVLIVIYVVSFLREVIFARYFGTDFSVDAFVIGSQIPIVLFTIVAIAIKTTIIPAYTKKILTESNENATKFINNLLSLLTFGMMPLIILGILFAPSIVKLFAPGFDESTHQLAVKILRLLFPTVLITIQINVYSAVLNVWKKFIMPQLVSIFNSFCIIVAILFCSSKYGIYAAVTGTILGAIFQWLYILFISRKIYKYKFHIDCKDADIKITAKKTIPVFMSVSLTEINIIISRAIASSLYIGGIAMLNYATKLSGVLGSLLGQAVSITSFPTFARQVTNKEFLELNKSINQIITILAAIIIPFSCWALLNSENIVMFAFGSEKFDYKATVLTANIFGYLTIGLFFNVLWEILNRVFFSFSDTKLPMICSGIGVLINIFLNFMLSRLMGISGLALATAISSFIVCIVLLIQLKKKMSTYNIRSSIIAFFKVILASFTAMISIVYIQGYLIINSLFYSLIFSFICYFIIYMLLLFFLRTKEVFDLFKYKKSKI